MKAALPEHRGWLAAAIGLPAYAFLYDNATSFPGAAGHAWTRLTPLTREVRLVEIAVIGALVAFALANGISRTTRLLLVGSLAFVGVGLSSYLRTANVPLLDGVRLIYMYLLPLWLFIIGREAPWGGEPWRRIAMTVLVWATASAAVSWMQLVWFGYPVGDDITGLNKDAHANGTLMMFVAIHFCAFALFLKDRRRALIPALAFLVTMVLSSVLKVMFFGIAALAILFWLYTRADPQRRQALTRRGLEWALVAGLTVAVVGVVFSRLDVLSSERLAPLIAKLREDPSSLGPLKAHEAAFSKIWVDLPTLLAGRGPFRFANPISVGQVLDAGRLGRQASGEVLAIQDEKGEDTRITLTSSLLAEFGAPALLTLVLMYGAVGRELFRSCGDQRVAVRVRAAGILGCAAILALVATSSLFGSIDVMSVSWPVMLLAGVVCRAASTPPETASSQSS